MERPRRIRRPLAGAASPSTVVEVGSRRIRPYAFPWGRLLLSLGAVLLAMALGATQGSVSVPLADVIKIIAAHLPGVSLDATWPQSSDVIVWELRLPRVLTAGMVGAALALSGATFQGLFRNPLADPYFIGAAGGAGLGATIVMVSSLPLEVHGLNTAALAAFLGALSTVTLAYTVARVGGGVPTTTLILAGVALASLTGAITTLLMLQADSDVRPVFSWLLGGFGQVGWRSTWLLLPYLVLGAGVILVHGRLLNVLQLDEEQARQMGINLERTKLVLVGASSLTTAAAVATAGLIGFVGLIAPHAVRLLWGPDHRSLLPLSMSVGAAFLVLADLVARIIISPAELPVGVVTAFCGVPFFLYLLRRSRGMAF